MRAFTNIFLSVALVINHYLLSSSLGSAKAVVIHQKKKQKCEKKSLISTNASRSANQNESQRYDPLECWLWNLQVIIPDQTFHESIFSLKIKDLVCTNFDIGSFESFPNSSSLNPSIDIYMHDISAECRGKYSSSGFSGELSASIQTQSDSPLHLQLTFTSKNINIPDDNLSLPTMNSKQYTIAEAGNVTDCDANLEVPTSGLNFYGSISASIINLFSSQIASFISFETSSQLCLSVTPGINDLLTQQISRANNFMIQLIVNQTHQQTEHQIDEGTPTDHDNDDDCKECVTWESGVPLLQQGLQMFNAFLSNYIDKGIIPVNTPVYDAFVSNSGTHHASTTTNRKLTAPPLDLSSLPPNALYPPHPQTLEQCEGLLFTGVNGLMKRLANNTNTIHITIPKEYRDSHYLIPGYGDIHLNLKSFSLQGIDSLESLEIVNPFDKRSFKNKIHFSSQLNVTLHIHLSVNPIPGGAIQGSPLEEYFDLHLDMSQAYLQGFAEVEAVKEKFDRVLVGHVASLLDMYLKDILQYDVHNKNSNLKTLDWKCILSSFDSFKFVDMMGNLSLNGIYFFNVPPAQNVSRTSRGLEDELDKLISDILNLLLNQYNAFVTDAVNGLFYGPIKIALNNIVAKIIQDMGSDEHHNNNQCSLVFPPNGGKYFHFDESNTFEYLESISNQIFGARNVNSVMECLALYDALEIQPWNPMYKKKMAAYTFSISSPDFTRMNGFQSISMLEPEIDHYHFKNSLDFNSCDHNTTVLNARTSCKPVAISTEVITASNKSKIDNRVNVTFFVNNFMSKTGIFTKYNMNTLYLMKFSKLMQQIQCGLTPLSVFKVYDLFEDLVFDSIHIDLNSSKPNGPEFHKLIVLDGEDINDGLSLLFSKGIPLFEPWLNSALQDILFRAPYICDGEIAPSHNDENKTRKLLSILRYIIISAAALVFTSMFFVRKQTSPEQPNTEMTELRNTGENDGKRYDQDMLTFLLLENFNDEEDNIEIEDVSLSAPDLNDNIEIDGLSQSHRIITGNSLLFCRDISLWIRCSVPLCLLCTAALFFSSNLSDGASVEVHLTSSSGESLTLPLPLFKFSLANTIKEMYQARVYTLMVIVALFSGIWPYVKIFLMLIAWVAPTHKFSATNREQLLIWLDALGKYSLVDANILVLMMVAFSLHLDFESLYTIDIFVIPKYGFYSFLLATILSLILGHFILFMHRQTSLKRSTNYGGVKESLRNHSFVVFESLGGLRLTIFSQTLIIVFLLFSLVLLFVGINVKSFYFTIEGVTGYMLGDEGIRGYSLLSLGKALLKSVDNPNSPGIKIIQTTFFFFAAVMPICSILIVLALFCLPMTLRSQRLMFIAAEIISAWSATEVFLLSILTALWQLSEFATFIVGDKCDLLNKVLREYFKDELGTNTFCFGIDAKTGPKSAYLIIAVIVSIMITTFVLRIAHQALEERMQREGELDREHNFNDTVIDKLLRSPLSKCFVAENDSNSNANESTYIFDSEGRRYERNESNMVSYEGLVGSIREPLIKAFNNSFETSSNLDAK